MDIGFEIDGIKFDLTSLENHPQHAASLARTFTSFSLIEGTIGGIYGLLNHQKYLIAVEELKNLGTNAKRAEAVRKMVKSELSEEEAVALEDLIKRVLRHAEERNKIAHGIWGFRADDDILYRLPVKRWVTFLASLIPNLADASDIIDDLNEHVESWSLNDFLLLEANGAQLLEEMVVTFNHLSIRATRRYL